MDEQSLFLRALEVQDPADREALLDSACQGDSALRQRVLALLSSHENAGVFLETPVLAQSDASPETPAAAAETQGNGNTCPLDNLLPCMARSQRPDSLGRLGHYEVLELMGRGGMGLVLRAFDEKLHRAVAIKVVSSELAASPHGRQRFVREARAAAAISHDNVVAIYAVEDEGPVPFLVMQLVAGRSLEKRLRAEGSLDLLEIVRIGQQVAAGLAAAHKQGLIHRDIKPGNILLENGAQRVKITDFGLARAVDDAGLTQSGMIAGTPLYMSPEQAQDVPIDARSDLFSLGSLMYAMAVGRPPFRGSTSVAVLRRVCDETPRPIQEINPDIPAWLCQIIEKLLAKNPADRYQTAREVTEALGERLFQLQQAAPATMLSSAPAVRAGPAVVLLPGERASLGAPPTTVVLPRTPRRRWPQLGAALFAAALVVAGIVSIQTNRGQIVIETDDPDIVFQVTPSGVRLEDRKINRQYDLKIARHDPQTGEYELEVSDEAAGVYFNTKKFIIRRGEKVALQAFHTLAGPADAPKAIVTSKRNASEPAAVPFDEQQAQAHQEAWGKRLGVEVEITNLLGMKLRLIPPGEFRMGSPQAEIDEALARSQDWNKPNVHVEGPQRVVRIEAPYYLAVHEVTIGQFRAFVKDAQYTTEGERTGKGGRKYDSSQRKMVLKPDYIWSHPFVSASDGQPVVLISREDTTAFCDWLTAKDRRTYSLPSDEQWEFACRAGTQSRWYWGDDPALVGRYAWFEDPSTGSRQMPVGQKLPNAFGLFDMAGNVSEMAVDVRDKIVMRGGHAGYPAWQLRSGAREYENHTDPTYRSGFRVAVTGDLKPRVGPAAGETP